jgi:hypothetical protein
VRWQPSVSRSVGPGGELQLRVGLPPGLTPNMRARQDTLAASLNGRQRHT